MKKKTVTIKGIGDIQILDLGDKLVKFNKSNNKYVWSLDKPKNITLQHRVINRHPNAKIKEPMRKL